MVRSLRQPSCWSCSPRSALASRAVRGGVVSPPGAAVAGTQADCVAAVREVAAAGAELILFTPMFSQAEHAEVLAAEIIPQIG